MPLLYLVTLSDAPFLGGDLRWPNGPWPGEKTPHFPAKTGHMARHGIWPSDRICVRWAGWVKPRHGLMTWRADWVSWPRRVTTWRADWVKPRRPSCWRAEWVHLHLAPTSSD